MNNVERDRINSTDDIFSTPVPHQYAQDPIPEDKLLCRESYNYSLPESQIAQVPLEDRAASRMLLLNKDTGEFEDTHFRALPGILNSGDVLVINDTAVIPARVFGSTLHLDKVELLLIRPEGDMWKTMIDSVLDSGDKIYFGPVGQTFGTATVLKQNDDNSYQIQFDTDVWDLLDKVGHTPLPPYIGNQDELEAKGIAERYNTIYSREKTSVAAPTAGLHFTESVIKQLEEKGVNILRVRLDVGLGTFRPVVVNDIRNHHMHTEHIVVNKEVIQGINAARARGNKVIAVGTTSLRTLESIPDEVWNNPSDFESDTSIFIYPGSGREIKSVDGLLTNFHAPESTLMMLVSTLAGYDNIMNAYKHAVDEGYRFLSLGDCMLLI